jgi:NADPH2:quinone reductase
MQGGSSGIGSIAIQMAHLFGARAVATAGNRVKCDFCEQMGAERAFNYKEENWMEAALAWTGGRGLDVILDMIGGDYFQRHLRMLAPRGRLVHISSSRGREVTADIALIMQKRLVVTGSTLRGRPVAEKSALRNAIRQRVWPHVAAGRIRPIVDRFFPLDQAGDAHRRMESSEHIGKILLQVA